MKASYIPDCTMSLVPETQVCPEATKHANAAPFTADSTSASSNTTIGACRDVVEEKTKCIRVRTHFPTQLGCVGGEIGADNFTKGSSSFSSGLVRINILWEGTEFEDVR